MDLKPIHSFFTCIVILYVPLQAASNDGVVEADGVWHEFTDGVIPRHPARNQAFSLELQTFRFDLTSASVSLSDGSQTWTVPMIWNREADNGTFDIWRADIAPIDSDYVYYHFQLNDGSGYATLNRANFWNGDPAYGDFLLNLTELGSYPLGATLEGSETVFRVWAPDVDQVQVMLNPAGPTTTFHAMTEVEGFWQVRLSNTSHGQAYKFRLLRDGNWLYRNDPYAKWLHQNLDHCFILRSDYSWNDHDWVIPDLEDCIISEAHVGTFSGRNDGASGHPASYQDLVDHHIAHLVESGINVLQLMPLQEFPGELSWGYNPAFLFAPESAYGSPEDFKYLVDKCHQAGIAVFLDIVLNHFDGPNLDGNLGDFNGEDIYFYSAESGYRDTGFGPRPDYGRIEVRDMLVDSVRFLIEEYHIDGFRLDHTNLIKVNGEGWRLMKEIDQMRQRVNPRVILTVEQWPNETAILTPVRWGGAGMDAQWSDPFHDNSRAALNDLAFSDPSMQSIADALNHFGYGASQMINFIESHDEARESPQFSFEGRIVQVADQINPHSEFGRGRGKLFYGLTMFGAAVPLILYGQEIATEIGYGDKESNKIPWERKTEYPGYFATCRDMTWLRRKSPALRADSNQNVYHLNEGANVLVWERSLNDHFVILVANFSNTDFGSYWIGLPQDGDWFQLINTNDSKYGGTDTLQNPKNLTAFNGPSGGLPYSIELQLPKHSMVILTKHDYDLTPTNLDADRDGMEDQWELANNLNPNLDFDGPLDDDGDLLTNLEEFLYFTDPFVKNPAPKLELLSTSGGYEIHFPTVTDRAYQIETSTNLIDWFPHLEEVSTRDQETPSTLLSTEENSDPAIFYQIKVRSDR